MNFNRSKKHVITAAPGGEQGGSAHSSRASSRHSSRHSSRRSSAASGSPSHRHRDSRAGSESPERAGRAGSATSQQSARSGRSHVSYRGDVKANDGSAEEDVVPGRVALAIPLCRRYCSSRMSVTCASLTSFSERRPPATSALLLHTLKRNQCCSVPLCIDLAGLQEPAAEPTETEAELVERVGQPSFRRRPIRATRKTSSFRCALTTPWTSPSCRSADAYMDIV